MAGSDDVVAVSLRRGAEFSGEVLDEIESHLSEGEEPKAPPEFPDEVAAIAALRAEFDKSGLTSVEWGEASGKFKIGQISCAEVSPTYLCTESCPGCPDSNLLRQQKNKEREAAGLPPKKEERTDIATFIRKSSTGLRELGVRHVMNIGGTIDKFKGDKTRGLREIIEAQLQEGLVVSWFTDGILQIDETSGEPNDLFRKSLETWLPHVATHVSTDYVYGHSSEEPLDLFADALTLPQKQGRVDEFRDDPRYSREFKSQYGAVEARRLVEAGVRRVVCNMTISHDNADQVDAIYRQAVRLQEYAESIGSPTEVLFTFSPMVWRAHQARGDNPAEHPRDGGLLPEDMSTVNAAMMRILDDTYQRLKEGRPRILANSSGYTYLHAEPAFRKEVLEQDVPYRRGLPLMLQVEPDGEVKLDPMFKGPELKEVRSTFGYMDRSPDPTQNPFSDFQHGNRPYLPNVISFERLDDPNAQPIRMMDRRLARLICHLGVIQFIPDGNGRNVSDSVHFVGNPRKLASNPYTMKYLAERMLHIVETECEGDVLVGIASFGLGLAEATSMLSAIVGRPIRNAYVKPNPEPQKSDGDVSGEINVDDLPIVIDDLIFHGNTTRKAMRILETNGYRHRPRHSAYIVDRQLQHAGNGPSLDQDGTMTHCAIAMDEIAEYQIENDFITPEVLAYLIQDYGMHERHNVPSFLRQS